MGLTPELFLDCLIILLNDTTERTRKMISDILDLYKEESKVQLEKNELIAFYIKIIRGIINGSVDLSLKNERMLFLLKFQSDPAVFKYPDIFPLLQKLFDERIDDENKVKDADVDSLEHRVQNVQNCLLWYRMNSAARKMFHTLNLARDSATTDTQNVELKKFLKEAEDIIDFVKKSNELGGGFPKPENRVSTNDEASMKKALSEFKHRSTGRGVIKSGLQGLNRALGKAGGLTLGESFTANARTHGYKSGMLQSWAYWTALYNVPPEPNKPNLILMISVENEAWRNFIWMFKKVYYIEYGEHAADRMSDDQLIMEAKKIFHKNGYTLEILRYLPSDFGFDDLVKVINYFETQGFSIPIIILDYLSKMKYGGSEKATSAVGNHLLIRELFSNCCNYTKSKGKCFITAHQLNRIADELAASGKKNVVKLYNNRCFADSSDVQREIDASLMMELVENYEGIKFLTAYLAKHRYVDDTPEKHKFFAYPFKENGVGIEDDINGPPGYVTDIYAYSVEDKNDQDEMVKDHSLKLKNEAISEGVNFF